MPVAFTRVEGSLAEEAPFFPPYHFTGFIDYFPDAVCAVANVSHVGNEQHHPGEPLHWSRDKSNDHADALGRHLLQRGSFDDDGLRHSAKVAWRAMALLQVELEG